MVPVILSPEGTWVLLHPILAVADYLKIWLILVAPSPLGWLLDLPLPRCVMQEYGSPGSYATGWFLKHFDPCMPILLISLVFLFIPLCACKALLWKGCVSRTGSQRCPRYSRAENQPLT